MSSYCIVVSPGAVHGLARRLGVLKDALETDAGVFDANSSGVAHRDLLKALDEFEKDWSDKRKDMRQGLEVSISHVRTIAGAFEQWDQDFADGFKAMAVPPSATGDGGTGGGAPGTRPVPGSAPTPGSETGPGSAPAPQPAPAPAPQPAPWVGTAPDHLHPLPVPVPLPRRPRPVVPGRRYPGRRYPGRVGGPGRANGPGRKSQGRGDRDLDVGRRPRSEHRDPGRRWRRGHRRHGHWGHRPGHQHHLDDHLVARRQVARPQVETNTDVRHAVDFARFPLDRGGDRA